MEFVQSAYNTKTGYPSLWYIKTNETFTVTERVQKRVWFRKRFIEVEVEKRLDYIVCKHGDNHYKTSNNPLENNGGGMGAKWVAITEDEFTKIIKIRFSNE